MLSFYFYSLYWLNVTYSHMHIGISMRIPYSNRKRWRSTRAGFWSFSSYMNFSFVSSTHSILGMHSMSFCSLSHRFCNRLSYTSFAHYLHIRLLRLATPHKCGLEGCLPRHSICLWLCSQDFSFSNWLNILKRRIHFAGQSLSSFQLLLIALFLWCSLVLDSRFNSTQLNHWLRSSKARTNYWTIGPGAILRKNMKHNWVSWRNPCTKCGSLLSH